jgi:hypothetical protein
MKMREMKYVAIVLAILVLGVSFYMLYEASTADILQVDILITEKPSAIVVTFRVSLRNTSPWAVEFRETRMTVWINGMTMPDPDSNPWGEFQLSPYETASVECTHGFYTAPSGYQISSIMVQIQGECKYGFESWHVFTLAKSIRA